jgi:DNA-binding transcriptional MocR family regulator
LLILTISDEEVYKGSFMKNEDFLYVQVASRMEKMIEKDLLKVGEKLPSVRQLSQEQGLSMSTVYQAYYHLEGKGLIEARPKSGYYVRYAPHKFLEIPEKTRPTNHVKQVSLDEIIRAVYQRLTSEETIYFSLSAPSLDMLPVAKLNKSLMWAMRNTKGHGVNYEEIQGNPGLRKQLARLAFNWGGTYTANDVVITNGCMEALALSLMAVTQPGDVIAIESPTYFGIFQLAESLGLKVLEIPCDPVTGVDVDYLDNAIPKFNIKACVFIPNFNNPMGSCMPDENKEKLVRILEKHEVPLIEDDIYGEHYFGKERPSTCKVFDKKGVVFYCASVSKLLAPGYRVGWCIPPAHVKDKVVKQKLMLNVSGTTLTQAAIAHFLATKRFDLHLRKLRSAIHTHCLRYMQAIADYFPEGTRLTRPRGGLMLWVALPENINAFELHNLAIQHNISIAPGHLFSSDQRYKNFIKICYGFPWNDKIDKALQTLGELITELNR